jgi:hypothetical protein
MQRHFRIRCDSMEEFTRIWSLVLEVVCRNKRCSAEIDAYPDNDWESFRELPIEVQEAQRALKNWAVTNQPTGAKENPRMAITPDMENEALREAVRLFGPFSISARVSDEDAEIVLENQDGGSGLVRISEKGKLQLAQAVSASGLQFDDVFKPLKANEPQFPKPRHFLGRRPKAR